MDMETIAEEEVSVEREKAISKPYIGQKFAGIGIFFGSVTILIFYLLSIRFGVNLPVPVFFISIALIALSLLYQIFFVELSKGFAGIIVFEMTVAAVAFHLIYQLPFYGIYGTDAYLDMTSMQAILQSGHIAGVQNYTQITSFFPVIHIMGANLSLVTGIDYYNVAKWFPSIIGAFSVPMVYLLSGYLFKREKAALLAALLFTCLQHYVMFSSLFVRETVAIVLAISSVYFFVSSKSSGHPVTYRILAILCLGGTIIAHHLTSLMLIVVLAIYWIFTMLAKIPTPREKLAADTQDRRVSFSFLLIAMIGTLMWWLTNVTQPVQIGIYFFDSLITPSSWGIHTIFNQDTMGIASLPNLRYYFLVYGTYISYFVFGLMLVYKSFSRRGAHFLETPVFTIYLLICGVLGFLSYFVLPPTIGGDRFLAFGWLFASGPLALTIIEYKNSLLVGFSAILILFFISINLFTIHPTMWDPNASGVGGAASKEDFAMAQTVDFSVGNIIGYQNDIMTVYDVQKILGDDTSLLLVPTNLSKYKWVIVNRASMGEEAIYSSYTKDILDKIKQLESGNSPDYNRLYESNNLAVLEKR